MRALALAQSGHLAAAEREFSTLDDAGWQAEERAAHRGRLAELRRLQGRPAEAIPLARDEAAQFGEHSLVWLRAEAHRALGLALEAAGRDAEALPVLGRARDEYHAIHLHPTADEADVLIALARAQSATGHALDGASTDAAGQSIVRMLAERPPVTVPPLRAATPTPANK